VSIIKIYYTIIAMKIYLFGNPDIFGDDVPFRFADSLKGKVEGIEFVTVNPNEDIPIISGDEIVIMDTVEGIDKVRLLNTNNLNELVIRKSISVHDWDLGFQLKYLKKLGKLKKISIIGIPRNKKVNYLRIRAILRKLVEQEMQGS
jgi:Ni,Fe-hydrogenase maturation factor